MSGCRDSLRDCVGDIYGVRDCLGLYKSEVFLITRTWSGQKIGEGGATEQKDKIYPTPNIVDYSHDIRLPEAGAIKQGDLMLRGIAMKYYPSESDIDGSSNAANVEKFYEVGGNLYRVIHVKEKMVSWQIHIRRLTDQTRY